MSPRKFFVLCAAIAVLLGVATAAQGVVVGKRTTLIVTPPPDSGKPAADGASDNSFFSQDSRVVKYMGFESTATDLAAGDTNGKKDVFLLERTQGEGSVGGNLSIGSVSSAGQPGNGDSSNGALDGEGTHCLVFQSTSTNLDPKDTSPDSDIFLRDLNTKQTSGISAKGNATDPSIDGKCKFVTYAAGGKIFVYDIKDKKTAPIARGTNPDETTNGKGVAYERGGQIYFQAYQKLFNKGNPTVKKTAKEVLVSKGQSGAGNGASKNPSTDSNGYYVAFESTATNLCQACKGVTGDANGPISDVFRATISAKAPTKDQMEMVSFSAGGGEQGNGPSNNPDMSGAGENVVFDSEATNLKESATILVADANGPVRDIYYWNFPRTRQEGNVSRESRDDSVPREAGTGQPLNGASTNPSASQRANYIGFTSNAAGQSGDTNGGGIADVFLRFLGGQSS